MTERQEAALAEFLRVMGEKPGDPPALDPTYAWPVDDRTPIMLTVCAYSGRIIGIENNSSGEAELTGDTIVSALHELCKDGRDHPLARYGKPETGARPFALEQDTEAPNGTQ